MNTQTYRANSIQEYHLTEQLIYGKFHDDLKNYDFISIVTLNLGKNQTSHRLLNLLYLAFVDFKSSDEKETILRDEYNIEITRDMKKELKKMGDLMEPAIELVIERMTDSIAKKAEAKALAKVEARATEIASKAAEVATAETKKQTILEHIRSMMKKLNMTAQQAMDALDVPADKQKEYLALI